MQVLCLGIPRISLSRFLLGFLLGIYRGNYGPRRSWEVLGGPRNAWEVLGSDRWLPRKSHVKVTKG